MTRCYKCNQILKLERDPMGSIEYYCIDCKIWVLTEWVDNPYIESIKDKLKEILEMFNEP